MTANDQDMYAALLELAMEEEEDEVEDGETSSDNFVILCKCKTPMIFIQARDAYGINSSITCDGCRKSITTHSFIFHCPNGKNRHHRNGYDFCNNCASKRSQQKTQPTNNYSYIPPTQSSSNTNNVSYVQPLQSNVNNPIQPPANHQQKFQSLENEIVRIRNEIQLSHNKYENCASEKVQISSELETYKIDSIHMQNEISQLKHTLKTGESTDEQIKESMQAKEQLKELRLEITEKSNVIQQQNCDMRNMKQTIKEMQLDLQSKNESSFKLSPVLKTILTQNFLIDNESDIASKEAYVFQLHNEILRLTLASLSSIKWIRMNCQQVKHISNENNNNINSKFGFSFTPDEPLININKFDLNTIRNLHKLLTVLKVKYDECSVEVYDWNEAFSKILNPGKSLLMSAQGEKDALMPNVRIWYEWNVGEIVDWIKSLDNGRYAKYDECIRKGMNNDKVNGGKLPSLTAVDFVMYDINDFEVGMRICQHIQELVSKYKKESGEKEKAVKQIV